MVAAFQRNTNLFCGKCFYHKALGYEFFFLNAKTHMNLYCKTMSKEKKKNPNQNKKKPLRSRRERIFYPQTTMDY